MLEKKRSTIGKRGQKWMKRGQNVEKGVKMGKKSQK